jgi:hypothetical protein
VWITERIEKNGVKRKEESVALFIGDEIVRPASLFLFFFDLNLI